MVSRAAAALVAAGVTAVAALRWPTPPAVADPPPTEVFITVAVGPDGQPLNGYQEVPSRGGVTTVDQCTSPSPSAVADDIYYCAPSAADAGTCWPAKPGSLLCIDNPWDMRMHRVGYGGPLPPVRPVATPDPFAMVLDDGTRCLLRNGGAWGGRDDGYVGVYGCGDPDAHLAVLWLPSQGAGTCIDRSAPVWRVKVGQVGTSSTPAPPPQIRPVTTAWFAGT